MDNLAATGGVPGPGSIGRVAIGDLLKRAASELHQRGVKVMLIACSELSIINKAIPEDFGAIDTLDVLAIDGFARQEELGHRIVLGCREREAQALAFFEEEFMRDLHQNAGTIAGARIRADRAPMFEIAEEGEGILDPPPRPDVRDCRGG